MAQNATAAAGDRRLTWKVFGALMVGALVGTRAELPYQLALTELPSSLPMPLWLLLAIGTVQNMLLFGVAAGPGLWRWWTYRIQVPSQAADWLVHRR